ncbi:MAG: response regulator [Rubrivivax sp.]|nr:MAG: response regulator [Rubrivivax sp.]
MSHCPRSSWRSPQALATLGNNNGRLPTCHAAVSHPKPSLAHSPYRADEPELVLSIHQTRARAMHEMLPMSMTFGLVAALGVGVILRTRTPVDGLIAWIIGRALITVLRLAHSFLTLKGRLGPAERTFWAYRGLSLLDGLMWGVLGWGLTPVMNLEVAVVTIGVLIGVAALGTFMLHVDRISAAAFIVPIMLPNAFHGLRRGDDLGAFCCVAILGLMALLLLEVRRSNIRLFEHLRLRFQSEQVSQAHAEALRQAEQLAETKGRFVATMSHEMRTPLHGILGLVRMLRQRESDPQAAHQLDLIRGSSDHLVNVINDILDFSRMEAGSLPVHQQAFNLHDLLDEIAETSQVSAAEKGLSLRVLLDVPPQVDVLGDPVRLRQVLHNLLGNAIKFTSAGFVCLHAWRDADSQQVLVAVEDSGIGIAPEEQARIFEAFHQAEGTYQRRFGGTGLGLTISRELARAMSGSLTCRSEVGRGSVFTLSLPLPTVAPTSSPAPFDGSRHVLLVDDNPVNAIVAEAELHSLGMRVTTLRDGQQAVQWLEGHQVDLVLMDCEMPELDGFEATRRIRDRERDTGRPPVRIVALTANGWDVCAQRCLSVGMNGHLAKPFRPDDLARVVNRQMSLKGCEDGAVSA